MSLDELANLGNYWFELIKNRLDGLIQVSCGARAQACDCKRERLWIRFRLEEMKYFIFLLNILRKVGKGTVLTLGSQISTVYSAICGTQREAKKQYVYKYVLLSRNRRVGT